MIGASQHRLFALIFLTACRANMTLDENVMDDASSGDQTFGEGGGDAKTCKGLACDIPSCAPGDGTTISGTVYAPNGTLPLYNAIVYVPNAELAPLADGVSCDKCGALASGAPLVVALSDASGSFKLKHTPAGMNVPLVIQIGKWRRKVVLPEVKPCMDNVASRKISGVEQVTRLPRNQSEGNMPKIAITTGMCDPLACIMPKIGIDPTEYAPGPASAQTKPKAAVSLYKGIGVDLPNSPLASDFRADEKQLENFDLAIFSCECGELPQGPDLDAVRKYLDAGGRIFTTDFQYTWYKYSSDANLRAASDWPGGAAPGVSPFVINESFPKGKALAEWMAHLASISPWKEQMTQPHQKGKLPVVVPYDNMHVFDPKYATSWASSWNHPRFLTMNMPSTKPPAEQCGKAVHFDAHISVGDIVDASFPAKCKADVKETELATIFFLFDLSSCIQKDTDNPIPPK